MFPPGPLSFSGSSAPPADTLPPVSDFPALVGPFPSARPPTSDPPLYSSRPPAPDGDPPADGAAVSPRRRGMPMPWVVAAVAVALFLGAWGSRHLTRGAGTDELVAPAAPQPIEAPAVAPPPDVAQTEPGRPEPTRPGKGDDEEGVPGAEPSASVSASAAANPAPLHAGPHAGPHAPLQPGAVPPRYYAPRSPKAPTTPPTAPTFLPSDI
jgi:hypothetical protein